MTMQTANQDMQTSALLKKTAKLHWKKSTKQLKCSQGPLCSLLVQNRKLTQKLYSSNLFFCSLTNRSLLKSVEEELQQRWVHLPWCVYIPWSNRTHPSANQILTAGLIDKSQAFLPAVATRADSGLCWVLSVLLACCTLWCRRGKAAERLTHTNTRLSCTFTNVHTNWGKRIQFVKIPNEYLGFSLVNRSGRLGNHLQFQNKFSVENENFFKCMLACILQY